MKCIYTIGILHEGAERESPCNTKGYTARYFKPMKTLEITGAPNDLSFLYKLKISVLIFLAS